jgi:hypothetical protein
MGRDLHFATTDGVVVVSRGAFHEASGTITRSLSLWAVEEDGITCTRDLDSITYQIDVLFHTGSTDLIISPIDARGRMASVGNRYNERTTAEIKVWSTRGTGTRVARLRYRPGDLCRFRNLSLSGSLLAAMVHTRFRFKCQLWCLEREELVQTIDLLELQAWHMPLTMLGASIVTTREEESHDAHRSQSLQVWEPRLWWRDAAWLSAAELAHRFTAPQPTEDLWMEDVLSAAYAGPGDDEDDLHSDGDDDVTSEGFPHLLSQLYGLYI